MEKSNRDAEDTSSANDGDVKSNRSEWTQVDKDLCKKIAESKDGQRFVKLYVGDTEGYDTQPEADLAFCSILAFWCAKDSEQMDRIYHQSKLSMPDWDEMQGELTYGEMTLQKAIDGTVTTYQGEPDPPPTTMNPFKLLTDDELAALPPIEWIIKGILPAKGLGVAFGSSGSGKSFLVYYMAQKIADGLDFFGNKTNQCNVTLAVLEGEGGAPGRNKAYRIKNGHTSKNIRYLIQPFNLLTDDVFKLAAAIKAAGGAGLVVIDTLNRAAPGADENGSKDMGLIITASKKLQTLINGFVLLVSHTGKDASKGIRGHSSLHAALDTVIEVRRKGNNREWSIPKVKDGEDGATYPFSLEVVEIGFDEDGDKITSCVVEQITTTQNQHSTKPLTDQQKQGLTAYHQAAEIDGQLDADGNFTGLHLDAWRQRFYAISTADTHGAKNKAFQRVRTDLIEVGLLTVRDDICRLQGPASGTLEAEFAIKLKAAQTLDTNGTNPGQVRLCDGITPDRQDTPFIKGCISPGQHMGNNDVEPDVENEEEFAI